MKNNILNSNLFKLSDQYLFSKVSSLIKSRNNVIDLSIGDVKLPLPTKVAEAGKRASEELAHFETFRGYPPERGYDFFADAVTGYYSRRGYKIIPDEVYVSDGIKSDMNLFLSILDSGKALIPSPAYPAYIEANIIRGNEIAFHDGTPSEKADIFILCSPDNPTGKTTDKACLKAWVDFARENGAIILYDAAYEAFANNAPRSIFEIEGARECAVEFCSLSKTAGFTGVRCGYTIVPRECGLGDAWRRAKSCLSNGVSYITQRMAACALTDALGDIEQNIAYYKENARIMCESLRGAEYTGGTESPYIWLKCGDSEKEFYKLLEEYGLGVTPGIGFGEKGKNHVRVNTFCSREDAYVAAQRLSKYLHDKS